MTNTIELGSSVLWISPSNDVWSAIVTHLYTAGDIEYAGFRFDGIVVPGHSRCGIWGPYGYTNMGDSPLQDLTFREANADDFEVQQAWNRKVDEHEAAVQAVANAKRALQMQCWSHTGPGTKVSWTRQIYDRMGKLINNKQQFSGVLVSIDWNRYVPVAIVNGKGHGDNKEYLNEPVPIDQVSFH